jgi:hypothetical protein
MGWGRTIPNISECFNDCIEFAQATLLPYSEDQIMNQATLVVCNTGLFYEDLKKWDAKPATHKSYKEFCDHNRRHSRSSEDKQQSSKQSGYGLAIQEIHDMTENFANFSMAIDQAEQDAKKTSH